MGIRVDFNVDISEKGVKLELKNVDVNNFTIDKIFKKIDKKVKKFKNSRKKTTEKLQSSEEGYYNIDIKV